MPLKLLFGPLEYALEGSRLRIGRADHLDITISGDPLVSSQHCVIQNGRLIDAQSTNGTQVNRVKIAHKEPIQLQPGDIVTVGETNLYVEDGVPYSGGTMPPSSAAKSATSSGLVVSGASSGPKGGLSSSSGRFGSRSFGSGFGVSTSASSGSASSSLHSSHSGFSSFDPDVTSSSSSSLNATTVVDSGPGFGSYALGNRERREREEKEEAEAEERATEANELAAMAAAAAGDSAATTTTVAASTGVSTDAHSLDSTIHSTTEWHAALSHAAHEGDADQDGQEVNDGGENSGASSKAIAAALQAGLSASSTHDEALAIAEERGASSSASASPFVYRAGGVGSRSMRPSPAGAAAAAAGDASTAHRPSSSPSTMRPGLSGAPVHPPPSSSPGGVGGAGGASSPGSDSDLVALRSALHHSDALRLQSEAKLRELTRKHATATAHLKQKVLKYEGQIQNLEYQLLYGDTLKDREVDMIKNVLLEDARVRALEADVDTLVQACARAVPPIALPLSQLGYTAVQAQQTWETIVDGTTTATTTTTGASTAGSADGTSPVTTFGSNRPSPTTATTTNSNTSNSGSRSGTLARSLSGSPASSAVEAASTSASSLPSSSSSSSLHSSTPAAILSSMRTPGLSPRPASGSEVVLSPSASLNLAASSSLGFLAALPSQMETLRESVDQVKSLLGAAVFTQWQARGSAAAAAAATAAAASDASPTTSTAAAVASPSLSSPSASAPPVTTSTPSLSTITAAAPAAVVAPADLDRLADRLLEKLHTVAASAVSTNQSQQAETLAAMLDQREQAQTIKLVECVQKATADAMQQQQQQQQQVAASSSSSSSPGASSGEHKNSHPPPVHADGRAGSLAALDATTEMALRGIMDSLTKLTDTQQEVQATVAAVLKQQQQQHAPAGSSKVSQPSGEDDPAAAVVGVAAVAWQQRVKDLETALEAERAVTANLAQAAAVQASRATAIAAVPPTVSASVSRTSSADGGKDVAAVQRSVEALQQRMTHLLGGAVLAVVAGLLLFK